MAATYRIRIALPAHLRNLAGVGREIRLEVVCDGEPTVTDLLDALEDRHPQLRGTVRDQATGRRRDYMRYFACGRDLSFESPDGPLPAAVASGEEAFRVVGAIAGGAEPADRPARSAGLRTGPRRGRPGGRAGGRRHFPGSNRPGGGVPSTGRDPLGAMGGA